MKLTPVEFIDGVYYKRDDYYTPFGVKHVNGGKVRQAIRLFETIHEDIVNNHNSGVVTGSSVHSPQGAIISKVAKERGLRCIVAVGATKPETLHKHHLVRLSEYYGAEVINVAGTGYQTAVDAGIKKKIISTNGYKLIKFAIALEKNPSAIFESVAEQVSNIPDILDTLVIPVGSGIQMAGILMGLKKYNKQVKRVVGVGFKDRRKVIDGYLKRFQCDLTSEYLGSAFNSYEMVLTPHTYSKQVVQKVNGELVDLIYEGKALEWMRQEPMRDSEKRLFWIVGRSFRKEEVDHILENTH